MANDLPNPESRKEAYLAKAAGMDVEIPEQPESRLEQYLEAIAEGGGGATYTAGDGIDITNDTISVDTNTIQEKLTAGDGISIADDIIKATNTGKARVLTTADYDYPDANPTGIALWRLPAGLYSLLPEVQGYTSIYFNTPQDANKGLWLLADAYYGADAVKSMYIFNGLDELQYYRTKISDGMRQLGQTFVVQIQNNLTTSSSGYVLDARQGKVLNDKIEGRIIQNAGTPTTSTVGTVGQLLEDTTNGKVYICTDTTGGSYTWTEVGAGGSGVTELSQSDYNWNYDTLTTTSPNAIGVFLLEPGIYRVKSNNTSNPNVFVSYYTGGGAMGVDQVTIIVTDSDHTSGPYGDYKSKLVTTIGSNLQTFIYDYNNSIQDGWSYTYSMAYANVTEMTNTISRKVTSAFRAPTADDTNADTGSIWVAIDNTVTPNTATIYTATDVSWSAVEQKLVATWAQVGGGSGPTVVQTTGTSTTDVMSQNAVSTLLFKDPLTMRRVAIGDGVQATQNVCTALGSYAYSTGWASVAISGGGNICRASGNNSVAIGETSSASADYSIALGGYSSASNQGEMNVGLSSFGSGHGYNNSNYRLISGVYDGQGLHDCATVAQGNTLATSAPTTTTEGVLGQLYTDTTNMHTYQCTAIDTTDPDNPVYTWTQRW